MSKVNVSEGRTVSVKTGDSLWIACTAAIRVAGDAWNKDELKSDGYINLSKLPTYTFFPDQT